MILASPGVLGRKWCVGEIVTAKLHDAPLTSLGGGGLGFRVWGLGLRV